MCTTALGIIRTLRSRPPNPEQQHSEGEPTDITHTRFVDIRSVKPDMTKDLATCGECSLLRVECTLSFCFCLSFFVSLLLSLSRWLRPVVFTSPNHPLSS